MNAELPQIQPVQPWVILREAQHMIQQPPNPATDNRIARIMPVNPPPMKGQNVGRGLIFPRFTGDNPVMLRAEVQRI